MWVPVVRPGARQLRLAHKLVDFAVHAAARALIEAIGRDTLAARPGAAGRLDVERNLGDLTVHTVQASLAEVAVKHGSEAAGEVAIDVAADRMGEDRWYQ